MRQTLAALWKGDKRGKQSVIALRRFRSLGLSRAKFLMPF